MRKIYSSPEFELLDMQKDVVLSSGNSNNLGEGDWGVQDEL